MNKTLEPYILLSGGIHCLFHIPYLHFYVFIFGFGSPGCI